MNDDHFHREYADEGDSWDEKTGAGCLVALVLAVVTFGLVVLAMWETWASWGWQ